MPFLPSITLPDWWEGLDIMQFHYCRCRDAICMNGGVAAPIQGKTSPHSAKSDPSNPCSRPKLMRAKAAPEGREFAKGFELIAEARAQEQGAEIELLPGAPAR